LVGDSWEGRTESRRRDLPQVDRDHAPSSLYSELDAEGTGGELWETGGDDPKRN